MLPPKNCAQLARVFYSHLASLSFLQHPLTLIIRQMAKHLNNEGRERLIELVFEKRLKLKDAAAALGLKYKTAHKIISVFSAEGRINRKGYNMNARKFGDEIKEAVVDFYQRNPDKTLKECIEYFRDNTEKFNGQIPSKSTIDRFLSGAKITYKALTAVPPQRNAEFTIKERKRFAIKFTKLENDGKHFIWLDEFGHNLSIRRRKGRSLVGTSAYITGPLQRGNNITVCAAIDKSGPIHYTYQLGGFNAERFQEFLVGLKAKLDPNKKNIIICDNSPVHKAEALKEFIVAENMRFFYLPPYSPMLNPIEECFSKVKGIIAARIAEIGSREAVRVAFDCVSSSDCEGWYRHMKRFFPQCLREKAIYKEVEDIVTSDEEQVEEEREESEESEIESLFEDELLENYI